MAKNVYQRAVESSAREAEGSGADHWTEHYKEQCRAGEREPMFTSRDADAGDGAGESGGGILAGLWKALSG